MKERRGFADSRRFPGEFPARREQCCPARSSSQYSEGKVTMPRLDEGHLHFSGPKDR